MSTLASLNAFEQVHYLLARGADWRKSNGNVALSTQEKDIGNVRATKWQIKVKHLLMTKGVKFPVPSSGAKRFATIRERWEQTPEGPRLARQARCPGHAARRGGQGLDQGGSAGPPGHAGLDAARRHSNAPL